LGTERKDSWWIDRRERGKEGKGGNEEGKGGREREREREREKRREERKEGRKDQEDNFPFHMEAN
jgi:hypothetical protein